ncbi:ComEA family DNA-binding protein [Curtobacterium sp. 458]|uniref:ComEA family DNA-binding protein n=1 Tax=Curtobacterium sp. 458 TaxID=3050069 RepID=UPI0025B5948F|nr:ComEA family DNA-binding protein [Curtobacterium sp. 458]WJX99711.1 ComEA family DNA-binding protein [Curtobacterium sp. 458]
MSSSIGPSSSDPASPSGPPAPSRSSSGSWSSRVALSPRAAMLLAGVVAAVALAVVVLSAGLGSGAGPSEVVVSGAVGGPGSPTASGLSGAAAVPAPSSPATAPVVVVHVAGAVADAGIVSLPSGSRVAAAVERAGGAARDADLGRLNLARPLVDGERVYVPRVGEGDPPAAVGPADGATDSAAGGPVDGSDVVDLNTADGATLERLPGIGPALAARIVAWREEHGRFAAVEDLLDVSGIGDAKFADLRDRVRV